MLDKYKKLFEIARYEYPSLYNKIVFIEKGKEFCVSFDMFTGDHIIYISEINYNDKHTKWLNNYLFNNYNLDVNEHMYYNFNEVFAFFHEVGHIYYSHENYNMENLYQNYKQKTYKKYEEAWEEYRQIPNEKEADEFAINIMKNNIYKIWSIMNDITEKQAKEEYNFWNI